MFYMTEMTIPFLVHRFTKYLYGFVHQSGPDLNLYAMPTFVHITSITLGQKSCVLEGRPSL